MSTIRPICVASASLLLVFASNSLGDEKPLYFPPIGGEWQKVEPKEVGWDAARLNAALDYAVKNQSSGVVVLHRGRILAERYSPVKGARSARFRQRIIGRDKAGRTIEDVASAQKSVASVLVGIAQEKKLLSIDDPVEKYLEPGWSKATREQEQAITIRHLITMTSGLTDDGKFEAKAGTKWRYNTWAYAKSMDVVAKAVGKNRHELTRGWLTKPLGMADSKWVRRRAPEIQAVNAFGFATSARDLARFGLMMLAKGKWNGESIIGDEKYLTNLTTSSQKMNPFYGYLWWVNRNGFLPKRRRLATAPIDMYSANGALNRRCFVVPSLGLVVTRLGDRPDAGRNFDRQFWKLLMEAAPKK